MTNGTTVLNNTAWNNHVLGRIDFSLFISCLVLAVANLRKQRISVITNAIERRMYTKLCATLWTWQEGLKRCSISIRTQVQVVLCHLYLFVRLGWTVLVKLSYSKRIKMCNAVSQTERCRSTEQKTIISNANSRSAMNEISAVRMLPFLFNTHHRLCAG